MNREAASTAMNTIVREIKSKGWSLTKVTQKSVREFDALGLRGINAEVDAYAEPGVKGAQIIDAVIRAAKQAGGRTVTESGWAGGDGWAHSSTTKPSALYLALNEVETIVEVVDAKSQTEKRAEYEAPVIYFDVGEQVEINRASWAGRPDDGERFDNWTSGKIVDAGKMMQDAFGGWVQQGIQVALPGGGIITRHYQPGRADEFIRKLGA